MSKFNWGYKSGTKQAKEAAGADKVSVKSHSRKPRAPAQTPLPVVKPKKGVC